jgi:hypothetical protein
VHVPVAANVRLEAFKPGDSVAGVDVGSGSTGTIVLPAQGAIHVVATENALPVPVRVQVLATNPPRVPDHYGEQSISGSRVSRT